MAARARAFEETGTLTSKGQVTIPKSVRQALGLSEGDQIAFRVDETGVTVRRADNQADDPAIASFLSFLAKDIAAHPEHLKAFPKDLATHIARLVKNVPFDPDAPIEGDVAL